MSFLAPAAFAFAAAIPVVIAFYLLKRKRVVRLVSSTLLWQRFLAETQANSPFQKLKHNWLLILQLLLLILLVFALARPFRAGETRPARLRVLVLDGSASMQATDVRPSRFEQARQEALQWVEGLREGEQIMILLAGAQAEVKQSPTSDKTALRRALASCRPSEAPSALVEALLTAAAFTYEKQGEEEVVTGEIHLFSDGSTTGLEQLENRNLPLIYYRVGESRDNVAIVSMEVRSNPENPAQRGVFANLVNYSTNEVEVELDLLFEEEMVDARVLTLAPTNRTPAVLVVPQERDGVFHLKMRVTQGRDELALDNEAWFYSRLPTAIRVLLVTQGNRPLEKMLRVLDYVELEAAPTVSESLPPYDVVVLDDVVPAVWPEVNLLAIHVADTNWFEVGGPRGPVAVVADRPDHPVLRFVSWDDVYIEEALKVEAPIWGIPLVEVRGTSPTEKQWPLVVAGEIDQRRVLWIGFNILRSNWTQRNGFPIFMANAMEWLNPASTDASRYHIQPGQAFRWRFAEPVSEAVVVKPDGKKDEALLRPETGELVFTRTGQRGVYHLQAGTNTVTFCVNLFDANESDITPRDTLALGKYAEVQADVKQKADIEYWRWIVLGGFAVLMFEWWYYHKRTV